ncbi:MAG: hypothetical protein R3E01_29720 [Pirellulaceae bacterium]
MSAVGRLSIVATAYLLFLTLISTNAAAQNVANQYYGRGVHAYYSGQTSQAEQYFNNAINMGAADPRYYYFRGLNYLRQGRQFEAEADFRQAAHFEMQGTTGANIGMALERIQGSQRMQLEAIRRETRAQYAMLRAQSPVTPATYPSTNPTISAPTESVEIPTPVEPLKRVPRSASELPADATDPFTDVDASGPIGTGVMEPVEDDNVQPPAAATPDPNVDALDFGADSLDSNDSDVSRDLTTENMFGSEPESSPDETAPAATDADDFFGTPAEDGTTAPLDEQPPVQPEPSSADDVFDNLDEGMDPGMNDSFNGGGPADSAEPAPADDAPTPPATDGSLDDIFGEL